MKFNNYEIYQTANTLMQIFDNLDIYIPAKANFFIQKNREIIINAAKEIDTTRMGIIQHYGELIPDAQEYHVSQENAEIVVKELQELFSIEQELNIKTFKLPILAVVFTLFELFGTMVLYVIENGAIGGMSYYGGILLMPIFAILLSLVFRIKYLDTMDLFATVAGAMVVMRVQCILTGCCGGKVLFTYKGTDIRFPNRIIEIITVLVLTIILLNLGKKVKYKGLLYPIYMISYGIVRFIINWFREGVTPFVWVLPAGNFWSLIAIAVNVLWIIVVIKNRKKLVTEDCNYIS
jgi:hypothetical protein